ncbi:hypothetical protein MRX96_011893 [Rhipicephalus microplus]
MQFEPGFQHQQSSRSTIWLPHDSGHVDPCCCNVPEVVDEEKAEVAVTVLFTRASHVQNISELSDLFTYWPGYAFGSSQSSRYHKSGKRRKSKSSSSSGPRSGAACLRHCQVLNLCSVVTTSSNIPGLVEVLTTRLQENDHY